MDKDDVRWLLDYAIEGRRRVKEQLKIMAGVEFIDVNLGYMDADNPQDVHVVRVPEQSEDTLIPDGPLLSGHVFGVGRSQGGEVAVYKLENKAVAGECKFKHEGVAFNKPVRDTLEAAFDNFVNLANRVAPGMHIGSKDYLLFYNDLQSKGLSEEVSLAEFVGLCSAACNRPVMPALAIPGILRMSGSMDEIRGLEDIMRVAKNAGAKRVILPAERYCGFAERVVRDHFGPEPGVLHGWRPGRRREEGSGSVGVRRAGLRTRGPRACWRVRVRRPCHGGRALRWRVARRAVWL